MVPGTRTFTDQEDTARMLAIILATSLLVQNAPAQPPIPVRSLGPVTTRSAVPFGTITNVREIAGGRVLVNDATRRQLVLLDASLLPTTVVADSAAAPIRYGARGAGIVAYLGDSTLFVDNASQSVVILDPQGRAGRALALPHAQDFSFLTGAANGTPGVDARGRLIYRGIIRIPGAGNITEKRPPAPDSAPIVRADLDTRAVDTLAWVRIAAFGGVQIRMENGKALSVEAQINPLRSPDDWLVTPNGSVAMIRTQDYHIDWIDIAGAKRSSPKMDFPWRRLSDQEKQRYADSAVAIAKQPFIEAMKGGSNIPLNITSVPLQEIPDYLGAVEVGTTRADFDGHVWILPSASTDVGTGKLYDIVNEAGLIVERVRVPQNRVVAGFGRQGAVYLSASEGALRYLEKAQIR